MITGLRPKSFENMQLNAGVFLENFAWEEAISVDDLTTKILEVLESEEGVLGATVGDGSFTCVPEVRNMEANGMRYPVMGSTVFDSWDIHLAGTMKEITPGNIERTLPTAVTETGTGNSSIKVIRVKTDLSKENYRKRLCWIGDTSKHGYILIELDNVLNISGANFTFTDKGEGTLPFDFQAHCATLTEMQYAPCRIVFFDPSAEASAVESGAAVQDETNQQESTTD